MEQTINKFYTPSTGILLPGGITIPGNLPYVKDCGSVIRAQLNRTKTTPEDFCNEHGLDLESFKDVINGKQSPTSELLVAIENTPALIAR